MEASVSQMISNLCSWLALGMTISGGGGGLLMLCGPAYVLLIYEPLGRLAPLRAATQAAQTTCAHTHTNTRGVSKERSARFGAFSRGW